MNVCLWVDQTEHAPVTLTGCFYISVCCVCCRMTVIVKEESLTLYKDQNVFTAVVLIPGTNAVFRQVAVNDFSNL